MLISCSSEAKPSCSSSHLLPLARLLYIVRESIPHRDLIPSWGSNPLTSHHLLAICRVFQCFSLSKKQSWFHHDLNVSHQVYSDTDLLCSPCRRHMHKRRVMLALRYVQTVFFDTLHCISISDLCSNLRPQSAYFIHDHFQHFKCPFSKIKFSFFFAFLTPHVHATLKLT